MSEAKISRTLSAIGSYDTLVAGSRSVVEVVGRPPRADQLIEIRIGRRGRVEIIVVEVDLDLVAGLLKLSAHAANRLRHDSNDLRAEVELEIDRAIAPLLNGSSTARFASGTEPAPTMRIW